jgi:alpha-ketoglutarate-dependent taurine dioxygenase
MAISTSAQALIGVIPLNVSRGFGAEIVNVDLCSMWDNRCTRHRRDPFDPSTRRIMHRTQVKGSAPPAT